MRTLAAAELDARARYQLITSLVVPRPIAWTSTWSQAGEANLAPFSYFAALSASPLLVGISIGQRDGRPKDTLANVRSRRAFCVNIVSQGFLEAMNESSAEVAPDIDEFELAGVDLAISGIVDAPYVKGCPAVLECVLSQEVALGDAPNTLIIGEVVGMRIAESLPFVDGTHVVDTAALQPVGRLWGAAYAMLGEVRLIPRPG